MANRREVMNCIIIQLQQLKKEHVEDLMKAKRVEELYGIIEEMDVLPLQVFCEENNLWLKIPEFKHYPYEWALYISRTGVTDIEIFDEPKEFIHFLEQMKEPLSRNIANNMRKANLCECTLQELIS
jgi:hypothetical protein